MVLEDPPWLSYLFLESPWVVMGICIVVGLGLIWRRRAGLGLIAIALAGVFWAVAWWVETDREAVLAASRELIEAAGPVDWAALDRLIEPDAAVTSDGWAVSLEWSTARGLLERAESRFGLNDQRLVNLQAQVTDTYRAVSVVDLRTSFEHGMGSGLPIGSVWLLQWEKQPDASWRVVEAQWISLQGRPPGEGVWLPIRSVP